MANLVELRTVIAQSKRGSQAITAFNIHNLETLQGVMEAVAQTGTPVILQTTWGTVEHAGADYLVAMARVAAERSGMDICLHLDHARSLAQVEHCLKAGYTSAMIDGSGLPYAENVSLTKACRELTTDYGASLEGEIGRLGGREELVDGGDGFLTDPEEGIAFAQETGVDALAVAIGTAHGLYTGTPNLDFDRLKKISDHLQIPLVLHGGSGVPEEQVRLAIKLGIRKVNFATELKLPFAQALREALNEGADDPRVFMGRGRAAVAQVAREKLKICMEV